MFTQLGGLNIISTDYNNDGYLDIYVLRGGWLMEEGEMIAGEFQDNVEDSDGSKENRGELEFYKFDFTKTMPKKNYNPLSQE